MNDALAWSLRYLGAGLSVLPVRPDGSKAPASDGWKRHQREAASEAEVRAWHDTPGRGVAVVGGAASGNLCVLDIEFADHHAVLSELVGQDAPGLLATLPAVRTPGSDPAGGRHLYFRTPAPVPCEKLARMSREEAVLRGKDADKRTMIETKAKGGYVLAPGCPPACHPSGRTYGWLPGPTVEEIPTLTDGEVRLLLGAARSMAAPDEEQVAACDRRQAGPRPDGSLAPGADYNARGDWADLLKRHGWKQVCQRGEAIWWRRPGKDRGVSATTGFCRSEKSGYMLYVFSSNAHPFGEGRCYSKAGAMALLEHGGDFAAAVSALGKQGYGDPPLSRRTLHVIAASAARPAGAQAATGEGVGEVPPDPATGGGLPAWPEGVFPPAIEAYVSAVALAQSCPRDFAGAAVLSAASQAVGSVRLLEVRRHWKEYGRLFLAVVGHPGTGKSPAQDAVFAPVIARQVDVDEEFRLDLAAYDEAAAARDRRRGEAEGPAPRRPVYRHLFTTNPTTEAMVPMLADNPRGVLVIKDELDGWVKGMNQYKGGQGDDRANWLSAWSGATIKVDRKGDRERGPILVPRPYVSLVGNVVPGSLRNLADPGGRSDGMLDRFLFVTPARTPVAEKIGDDLPASVETAWLAALEEMWSWRPAFDGGRPAPAHVALAPCGLEATDAWYAAHARKMNAADFPARLLGQFSKLRAYYFRLCLLIHCLREACGEDVYAGVDADTALRAAMLVEYFVAHARAAYAVMAQSAEDEQAEDALEWILAHGGRATARDLVRARLARRATEAEALLADLADRQFGGLEMPARRPGAPGRPGGPTFVAAGRGGDPVAEIYRPEERGAVS